jgi:hypothetical protein
VLLLMSKPVRPRDIKDGAINVLAVGERGAFVVQNAWRGAVGDGRDSANVLAIVSKAAPIPSSPSLRVSLARTPESLSS